MDGKKIVIKELAITFIILFAFCVICAGGYFIGYFSRSGSAGELDQRYDSQHSRAAEIIDRLEGELERERDLNRQLREHNNRARELTKGLTNSVNRNVRNLQDAVSIIGEIRTKLKILADFYDSSNSGYGDN